MKTYQVSYYEPEAYKIKKIATVEADYFEVGPNGDLMFFSLSPFGYGKQSPILHTAFASGQWARVEPVEDEE